jgi:hypothetical protein
MINQSWLVIVSVGFLIIVLIFLAAIGFLIYALMELKKIGANQKEFLKITEEKMLPLLNEAEMTLRSVRKVSDDVGRVTENAKAFSDAATDIVVNLRIMSMLVKDLQEGLMIRTSGLKAGFREAYEMLIKQLKERR